MAIIIDNGVIEDSLRERTNAVLDNFLEGVQYVAESNSEDFNRRRRIYYKNVSAGES